MSEIVMVVGLLAFAVSVIVEVVKGVKMFNKVPTDLMVLMLSLVLTFVAGFSYASYNAIAIKVYMISSMFIGSFFVAFIAMYGWDKLNTLFNRFKR